MKEDDDDAAAQLLNFFVKAKEEDDDVNNVLKFSVKAKEDVARVLNFLSKAKALVEKGDYIKALEKITESLTQIHGEEKGSWLFHAEEGNIFLKLAEKTEKKNLDLKFAYNLASASCFSTDPRLSRLCAYRLYDLAEHLGSVLYFKKCVEIAKQSFSVDTSLDNMSLREYVPGTKEGLERLIENAESKIALSRTTSLKRREADVSLEVKESTEPCVEDEFKELRSYWMRLDVKARREYMIVSVAELKSYVERRHKSKGRRDLEEILSSAKGHKQWTFWLCRCLSKQMFDSSEGCKTHLEEEHNLDFKLSSEVFRVKRIENEWARKISVGGWEPVDAVAAVEMIKNQLEFVKAFTSKSKRNGWSKEWPLAVDEDRSELLQKIKLLLVRLCELRILSCCIRYWVMHFLRGRLWKLAVSKESLVDSRLMETPQGICFLECHELSQIRNSLEQIKCERHDGTDVVCRALESFWCGTRVKEKIDFDPKFSFLLLDKRLLRSSLVNAPFDDKGTIDVYDPKTHYNKANVHGDDFISWLVNRSSEDDSFPKHVQKIDLGIWMSALKAVQFTCSALGAKYQKKMQVLEYGLGLGAAEHMCLDENVRRRDLQGYRGQSFASLLHERALRDTHIPKAFLFVVRDVLEGASHPTFDFHDLDGCLNSIRERKSPKDEIVWKSTETLRSVFNHKNLLIESKILLIDNSRIRLLDSLTKLSFSDDRSQLLPLLKSFLLDKVKSDVLIEDLLREEEKEKSQANKKKVKKKIKRTSKSMHSPRDKIVKHESEGTSPPLKPVEEDSMEPEDTLASEKIPLEISSDTNHQQEATNDMQSLPGEDSRLEEAAARYNSALDMTLQALMNINILREDLKRNTKPFQQVPCALQNFFTAVVSEEIKNNGVYSFLLEGILASLEEVRSMRSDAAEVIVNILEYWHSWKPSETESLVTRLFTLEEIEGMSCRECRRKTNYQEQSSYGIVIAADSIRQLKCEFGSVKFVDILKMIRLEDQMVCDTRTGGCGETNFFHRVMTRCPSIFIIVLTWEKNETEKEVSKTTNALDLEIDISRLYKGLEPNTNYHLVSMVGCGEEEEHVCIAYEKKRWWVSLKREFFAAEDVGNWESAVRFFEKKKIRPEILFYEKLPRT